MRNRFVLFVLIIIILFPVLSKPVCAKGQVKEIDALFSDLRLQIEGQSFPHKETFIYDGELWVPMRELARVLNLDYSFDYNRRVIKLDSKGRLNSDANLEPIVYQRGYEIQAKERRIAELDREIREFEGRRTGSGEKVDGIVRNIRVSFSDIDVSLDGGSVYLDKEPLIYNGDVYASIISLSPVLYITPELEGSTVNVDANAILVNKPNSCFGNYSLNELLSFREALNDRLNRELAELEKKKKILMDVKIPYEHIVDLKDMEGYINRYLSRIKDLPVSVTLKAARDSWYSVDIRFRTRDAYRWDELNRRDVEAYVWDIFVAIASLYDGEAKVQGQIRNPYQSRYNYVEFNTHMRSIVFEFINSGLDMKDKVDPKYIEDLLKQELGRYNGESFNYIARISGYDLELIINPKSRYYFDRWNTWNKIDFLREIDYVIKEYYPGLCINGTIEYMDRDSIQFMIRDGKIRSLDLERETEEFLNDRYGIFVSKALRIPMKYKLSPIDINDCKLLAYMDFDINNMDRTLEDELGAFLQDVVAEIISLWDVNIFLQVFDKNQFIVKEIVISQDTAQMVNANPASGEIVEGSIVELYTNTLGANIYYALNGSAPTPSNRILYTEPIIINRDTVIQAYATKAGMKDSPISTFEYATVDDDSIARGLDGLNILNGKLEPIFHRKTFNYEVNVEYPVNALSIVITANTGSIKINGQYVESGNRHDIELETGQNMINIVHEESGKTDRIYTIVAKRKEMDAPMVWLAGYTFNTSVVVVFKGNLASDSIRTFHGYKMELLSKTGKHFKTVDISPEGSFEMVATNVDIWDKLIGFKYRILDPDGIPIPRDEDDNVLEPR